MADFGKLNFSVAFNPTSAFVLDARCYFESLEAAKAAALTADEVGSTTTVYYFGQKLLVNEGGTSKWYTITNQKTLEAEGSGGDGTTYVIGRGLKLDSATNTLSVDATDKVEQNNTKPITAAAVYTEVGNINALLETI